MIGCSVVPMRYCFEFCFNRNLSIGRLGKLLEFVDSSTLDSSFLECILQRFGYEHIIYLVELAALLVGPTSTEIVVKLQFENVE